jgi:tRNA pseudouridine13 synthase
MKILDFNWNIKEKPEDFIVKEIMDIPFSEKGKYHIYLLVKRNMNTKEITAPYRLFYAGLKDKNALTFQYVSTKKYFGELIKEKNEDGKFFFLLHIGKSIKQIKVGHLKGNKFSIRLKGHKINTKKDWFINYFDTQRLSKNLVKGKSLLLSVDKNKTWKQLKWVEHFYIEAYLSYLWNRSLQLYLMDNYDGYLIKDKNITFFIPYTDYQSLMSKKKKFWTILGNKVKIDDLEEKYYSQILRDENIELQFLMEKLKDLKLRGDYRKFFIKAEDIKINSERIEFFIPKGGYATMFLKHIYIS